MTTHRNTRNIKNEPVKVLGGFVTPNSSMSTGILIPKQENIEMSFSDMTEGAPENSFVSHNGLQDQIDFDEKYTNQSKERNVRSDAPSFQPSRQASLSRESFDLTMDSKTPGASLQIVGKKVNLLVNAIDKLRQLGLKEIDTELPELVLVGDQSAGKSTLMGAIAEINLPKDKGMCTRCPANIKTSPAQIWSCSVSLHEYYTFSHGSQRRVTTAQPFPPWKENPQGLEITPFKRINDKSELEDVLRWAQVALLNPSTDPKSYVPGTGIIAQKGINPGEKQEADFSPNLVAIEIAGPGLPSLSFYDLPGIFVSAASKEEGYLVEVFEKLATKYIKHPNALIICAMTMQTDPGNSRTSAIIEKLKAEARCVRVLTMPDRLQEGSSHFDFDKLLRGQAHYLPRGYFVTKQPGPDFKLRQSDYHAQARQEEEAFFANDLRWTGEWDEFRNRCGTAAIQNYLSQEFAKQIANSMPKINEKIKAQAKEVDDALNALPELPHHNVQHVVRAHLQQFSNGVQRLLEGGATSNGFLSSWSQLSNDFRDAIQTMKPKFVYSDSSDMELPEVISIDDDTDDEEHTPQLPNRNLKRPYEPCITPPQGRMKLHSDSDVSGTRNATSPRLVPFQQSVPRSTKQEGGSSFNTPTHPIQRRIAQPVKRVERKTPFEPFLGIGDSFSTIAEVREVISKHKRPGLPDHINDSAKEEICLQSVNSWNLPLDTFAEHTFRMLREGLIGVLNSYLGEFKQTQLYKTSERNIRQFLSTLEIEQRNALNAFYDLESYKLFTINYPAFEMYKAEELKILENARRDRRIRCHVSKQAHLQNKVLTDAQRSKDEKRLRDRDDDLLGPDPFRNEIQLAAYVRGYYKVAGLRFTDNVCQHIEGNMFRKVHAQIIGLLEGCLGLNEGDGEQICKNLMSEDPNEGRMRKELQNKKIRLVKAADSLVELVRKYTLDDDRASTQPIQQPTPPDFIGDRGDGMDDPETTITVQGSQNEDLSSPSP